MQFYNQYLQIKKTDFRPIFERETIQYYEQKAREEKINIERLQIENDAFNDIVTQKIKNERDLIQKNFDLKEEINQLKEDHRSSIEEKDNEYNLMKEKMDTILSNYQED